MSIGPALAVLGCWIKGDAIATVERDGESSENVCLRAKAFRVYMAMKATPVCDTPRKGC